MGKSPKLLGPQLPQMVNEGDYVVISQETLGALLAKLLYSGTQTIASSQLLASSSGLSGNFN